MNKTAISYFLSCAILLLIASCSSYKFSKSGVFVNDVDEYFNPAENINVWVYLNFRPQASESVGVRLKDLYPLDKEILKHSKVSGKNSKVLFSAIPESSPQYNLIAIHHKKQLDTIGFKRVVGIDKSYYFQKDFIKDRLDIRHVLIPYGPKEALSLLYYISTEKHLNAPFAKLDYLARINALELQKGQQYSSSWRIAECDNGKFVNKVIPLPESLVDRKEPLYLKVFKDYGHTTGIQYFKVVNPRAEKTINLDLCKSRYFVEFQDKEERLLHRDSLEIL